MTDQYETLTDADLDRFGEDIERVVDAVLPLLLAQSEVVEACWTCIAPLVTADAATDAAQRAAASTPVGEAQRPGRAG